MRNNKNVIGVIVTLVIIGVVVVILLSSGNGSEANGSEIEMIASDETDVPVDSYDLESTTETDTNIYLPSVVVEVTPTSTSTSSPPTATPTPDIIVNPDAMVIDHNSVALFDQIPANYLEAARNLNMVFSDRSVGQNINESLDCLASSSWAESPAFCRRDYTDDNWNWKTFNETDRLNGIVPDRILFDADSVIYNRNNWVFEFRAGSWSSLTQDFVESLAPQYIITSTVLSYQFSYLNVGENSNIADPDTGFFADTANSYDIYDLEAYINQHPDKRFVFWTSSLARSIGAQVSVDFNNQMRQYALANGKVLFDVADIQAQTDQGAACYDNRDGVQYCNQTDDCENHPDDGLDLLAICQDYTTELDGGHLGSVSAGKIQIAKAFWVLMARIAGWDGATIVDAPETLTPMPSSPTPEATTATSTPLPPTATSSPFPPTATSTSTPPVETSTPTTVPPTATSTSSPPTATPTPDIIVNPDAMVIDHNNVALFDHIPANYLEAARNLNMLFSDRSVGQNINEALGCLAASSWAASPAHCRRDYYDDNWNWRVFNEADRLNGIVPERILFDADSVIYNRNNWDFEARTGSWSSLTQDFIESMAPQYINSSDVLSYQFSYLNVDESSNIANPNTGFFADTANNYDIYDLEAYINQYPNKVFFFWTTSLSRAIGTQVSTDFNNQMRQYALENGKVLFDVADIEAHTDQGAACYDNRDGVQYCTQTNDCENHPDDGLDLLAICQDYTTELDGGHLGSVSAGKIQIVKAFWVLMARIAGWDGTISQ